MRLKPLQMFQLHVCVPTGRKLVFQSPAVDVRDKETRNVVITSPSLSHFTSCVALAHLALLAAIL